MSESSKITFEYLKRNLVFKFDAGTSRGVLKTKEIFWIKAFHANTPEVIGWGEAAPLVNLSPDDRPDFEEVLQILLKEMSQMSWKENELSILNQLANLIPFELPSIRFGLETAILDLKNGGTKKILGDEFHKGEKAISINGLIWMGAKDFMLDQIKEKLEQGFDCIKMKIGAIDFQQELDLLSYIRERFSKDQITLRVDANGAFSANDALTKLQQLATYDLHSIEQPIAAGDRNAMKNLCEATPLPIALDEELIGVRNKAELLDEIHPQHIILKPTLLGGILETKKWIELAEARNIGWWMTSALESNIALNAISQLADELDTSIPQGLGTGKLYQNNLGSPLEIQKGKIHYNSQVLWEQPS